MNSEGVDRGRASESTRRGGGSHQGEQHVSSANDINRGAKSWRRRDKLVRNGLLEMLQHGDGSSDTVPQLSPPPPPPWPPPREGNSSLKDLLSQVAPQARIVENSSRLATRSSVRIQAGLSRVLAEVKDVPSWYFQGDDDDLFEEVHYDTYDDAAPSTTEEGSASSAGTGANGRPPGGWRTVDDDDAPEFLERWNGLFSKGSALDGSDPFRDLNRRRVKVIWKKNGERPGHHSRYQKRRQQREDKPSANGWSGSKEASSSTRESQEDEVALVFDASKNPPLTE